MRYAAVETRNVDNINNPMPLLTKISEKREGKVININLISILDYLPKDIFILIGFLFLDNKSKNSYVLTCKTINHFFQPDFNKLIFKELLQSVVDDDSKAVERILKIKPFLLLQDPEKNFVIESKLTWQKFYAEKVGVMAAKRKQIKMLTLLFPYYDKL